MKEKLQVLANLLHFRTAFMQACHDAKVPYSQTKVEALIDIEDKLSPLICPIVDVAYDKIRNAVIVYIDGKQLKH